MFSCISLKFLVFFQLTIGSFGLLGNWVSLVILFNKHLKNPFNRLLMLLSLFDSFLICFVLFDYTFVRGILLMFMIVCLEITWILFSFSMATESDSYPLCLHLSQVSLSYQQHSTLLLYIHYHRHSLRKVCKKCFKE